MDNQENNEPLEEFQLVPPIPGEPLLSVYFPEDYQNVYHYIDNPPSFYLDFNISSELSVKIFKHSSDKYKFKINLAVALHPKVWITRRLIKRFAEFISEETSNRILSQALHSPDPIVQSAIQTYSKNFKFSTKYLDRIQKKLSKSIRKNWEFGSLELLLIQTEHKFIL